MLWDGLPVVAQDRGYAETEFLAGGFDGSLEGFVGNLKGWQDVEVAF